MSTHMHMAKSGWPSVLVVWCFVPPTTVTPAYSGQGDPVLCYVILLTVGRAME